MAKIEIPAFTGLNLRAAPHLLKPGEATNAHDCVLDSGAIVPLKDATSVEAVVSSGIKAIYYWNNALQTATTDRWYAEAGQYLYWADGGVPQKVKAGGIQRRLGVEPPSTGPTVASVSSVNSRLLLPTTGRQYLVTFVTSDGAESAPQAQPVKMTPITTFLNTYLSTTDTGVALRINGNAIPGSGAIYINGEIISYTSRSLDPANTILSGVTRGANGTVAKSHELGASVTFVYDHIALSGIPTAAAGSDVTSRRIYALVSGEFRLLSTLADNTTTTFNDNKSDADLSSNHILGSDDHDLPPNLTGIVGPHNGMMFGWVGRALRWTKVGNFDAWPEEYTFDDFPAPITCAVPWGGFLVVFTAESAYTVSGSDPEALSRFKVQGTVGTTYPRSVVNIGPGLLYVSNRGVEIFDGIISKSLSYDKLGEQVILVNPRAAFFRGRAFIFHGGASLNGKTMPSGCLIADLRAGDPVWTTSGITTPVPYVRPAVDQLYLVSGTNLVRWGSGSARTWSYSTGLLDAQDGRQGKLYSVLRLDAEGAVTATPKVNGAAIGSPAFAVSTSGTRAQHRKRLPPERGERFSLDLGGTGSLHGITLEYQ